MSKELDQALAVIYHSNDPNLQDLANRAIQLKSALEQGAISKSEYTEMITDLYHEKNINDAVQDLQMKEYVNTTMTALINLASLV